jgi:hypothetical protein
MRALYVALYAAGLALVSACNDATHDIQVGMLGGEDPSVPQGPFHRPGQPCLVCHGGQGPASAQFSVGGTVYMFQTSKQTPATGATVQVEDINGSVGTSTVNTAGNFYIPSSQWQPTYPTLPKVTLGNMPQSMTTHVGREGSCAKCHSDPTSPISAGHIYIVPGGPDGGM